MWNSSLMHLMQEEDKEKQVSVISNRESSTSQTSLEWFPVSIISHGPTSSRVNPLEVDTHDGSSSNDYDAKITVDDNDEGMKNVEEFNPEAWLPITESRNGNLYYCIFHLISSGIGIQSLALPFAFVSLGWVWGIMWLTVAFIWQLYTLWLLVRLHESNSGYRYSRYLQLAMSAFGPKLGKMLALFPVMYLSGGSCVMLLITGGTTMQKLHQILYENGLIAPTRSLTTIEWYLVFICLAIAIAQLPNLNSVAWVSLVSTITALVYCSLVWILSVTEGGGPSKTEFTPVFKGPETGLSRLMTVISAIGIISFSFRGHNLVLEIQGTLPTSPKDPTERRMWKGVIVSYTLIALCLFPLAIAGFWAYGTLMPKAGLLNAYGEFHGNHGSKLSMAVIYFFLIINSLCSFQIYAMPVFDNLELRVVSIRKKPCSGWTRTGLRIFFGGVAFLISVAFPFLPLLSPLIGGIALPITFAYPCFMWISIKKPAPYGSMWWLNLVLGCL
ncbi:hypothetical protein KSS87_005398, partial [Heliosperma pusillum]